MFTLIGIVSYFIFIPIIERTSKSKIFSHSLIVFGLAYLVFAFTKSFQIFLLTAIILTITGTLRVTSFGLMKKDYSKKSQLSRNEGLMFTFANIAFVIGPLLAGYIANKNGINNVFILSAIFIFLAFTILKLEKVKDDRKQKKTHKNLFKNFFAFFKDKHRILAYLIGGGVGFWWVLIYLFIPLQIVRSGLSNLWIGYFLFAIPIPLIILEYRFAKIGGEKGFKKLFQFGFLIPAIATLAAFFLVDSIFAIMAVMIVGSIGLAMLEPTSEAYFFDISTKKDEQRFYGPYNTRLEVAGFVGKLIPAIILLVLPFKYVYLFFSIMMFLLFLASSKTKNVREGK